MASPTDFEQMMLELINSARMDPQADFDRYISSYSPLESEDADIDNAMSFFGVVGTTLKSQVDALVSAAPLAWNSALNEAAAKHTTKMIEEDTQSHLLPGEASLGDRIRDEGYSFSRVGENVFAFTESPLYGHAGFMVDWGVGVDGIQDPAGHRNSIMNEAFREVGIGVEEDTDPNTDVGPFVMTQNFGVRLSMPETILTGVIFNDTDNDDFYSLGEGTSGITVSLGDDAETTSASAGGYNIDTTAGTKELTFSGGSLGDGFSVDIELAAENAKVDLINSFHLKSTVSVEMGEGLANVTLYSDGDASITGNSGKNRLVGNSGDNEIRGDSGNDKLFGLEGRDKLFGGAAHDTIRGNAGKDRIDGGKGRDSLRGDKGKDRLEGGKGDDTLSGGTGRDKFDFDHLNWGDDTITDWEDGRDTLDFRSMDLEFSDFDFTQQGDDVLVTADGATGTILIENANEADFSEADFLFPA
ncbi:MAG: hypothetical protein Alpg2KO_29760 [Alphaproteobacteria bacterium]